MPSVAGVHCVFIKDSDRHVSVVNFVYRGGYLSYTKIMFYTLKLSTLRLTQTIKAGQCSF